jgi:hypothetical protein
MIAANNVYNLAINGDFSIDKIQKAEHLIQNSLKTGEGINNESFNKALKVVNKQLNNLVYRLFNKRVYYFKQGIVKRYADQPLLIYGGGSLLPILREGSIMIHDNGNRSSIIIECTYLEKQNIDRFTSIINVSPVDGSWKSDLSLLAVALGLSFINPQGFTGWFRDEEYHSHDGDKLVEVPHPFNEDCYIYNVLTSSWD